MGGYYREVLTAADWRQINMQLPFQSVSDKQTPLAPRCFACVERPVPLALVVTTHLASPCLVLFGEGFLLRSRAYARGSSLLSSTPYFHLVGPTKAKRKLSSCRSPWSPGAGCFSAPSSKNKRKTAVVHVHVSSDQVCSY